MKTDALIRALAQNAGRRVIPVNRLVRMALLGGGAVSLLMFALVLNPRPDIATALQSPGFCLKLAAAICLALTSAGLLDPLARPLPPQRRLRVLSVGPLLLLAGVAIELALLPKAAWLPRLFGHNPSHCVALISLLSAAPAVCLHLAMRQAAPRRPGITGAVSGLAAGGLGSFVYAISCPNDSPLFISTWYVLAIVLVACVSFLAGRRWLIW